MKSTKQWLQHIFLGVIACAAGVFIFFQTNNFAKVMVIGIGAFAFVHGSGALILTVKSQFDEKIRSLLLIRGILGVVVGIVAVLLPLASKKDIWSLMLYVLAGALTISVVLILLTMNGLKKSGTPLTRSLITLGISTAFALVIFIMPQDSGQLVLSVIAGIIVIYGIAMILAGMSRKKSVSESAGPSFAEEPAIEKKGKKRGKKVPADQVQEPVADASAGTDASSEQKKPQE
ncbi:MAG: DUF308 domain-containing protein [Spirochaetes bacterium]|nr:DUF308 domain-containing protein [Spirochaetota bacterium]